MRPLVCEYLRTHSLAELEAEYKVRYRVSKDGRRASLNYAKDAPCGVVLIEQCRGLILAMGSWDVVAWPLNRFYHDGDAHAATINWSSPTLRIEEKLDGTMGILYWDPFREIWSVGTRMMPDADKPIVPSQLVKERTFTFAQLFHDGWLPEKLSLDKQCTWVFEITSPKNRVVVRYSETALTLLAARNIVTGEELSPTELDETGVPRPRLMPARSLGELRSMIVARPPEELEGAVVSDGSARIKVKSPPWMALAYSREKYTRTELSLLTSLLYGCYDSIAHLLDDDEQEYAKWLHTMTKRYFVHVYERYEEFCSAATRKEFAAAVLGSGEWPHIFFALRDASYNISEIIGARIGDKPFMKQLLAEVKSYAERIREESGTS